MPCRILFFVLFALSLTAGLALTGCGTHTWIIEKAETARITWPPAPARARITLLYEIRGFHDSGRMFSDLLYGQDSQGMLGKPAAVTVGTDGRLAVADMAKKGVHLYDPSRKTYTFISAGRDAAGNIMPLKTPVGITFDDSGMLYVADSTRRRVFIFDQKGTPSGSITEACGTRLRRPSGIAFSPRHGTILLLDTLLNRLLVLDRRGVCHESTGSRGTGQDEFNFPTHIATDGNGGIYITDALNFRIKILQGAGGDATWFGHHGDGSGDFAMPKGVAVDRTGIIYVADTLFDNIQLFDRQGRLLLTVGGRGTGPGEFWMPSGIFIDANSRLYVCDTWNKRVQVFAINTKTGERPAIAPGENKDEAAPPGNSSIAEND